MNNMSTSECSSGCESGWTTYLDQSSNSAEQYPRGTSNNKYNNNHWSRGVNNVNEHSEEDDDGEEEDEDLSMVSDASSGPRNFHQEESCGGYFSYGATSISEQVRSDKQKKKKINRAYHLDDTASSHAFSFSKKNLVVSNGQDSMEEEEEEKGFSITHFKGKSSLKKKFGFLKSSASGKSTSEKSGVRKW